MSEAQLSSSLATAPSLSVKDAAKGKPQTNVFSFFLDLVDLTKPRIMVLLLISTVCPMVLAANGRFPFREILWALIGGALTSGSASAINCIWDRDIDSVMERTKNRPIPAGRVSSRAAILWSVLLGVLGVGVIALNLNIYAALVALFGHFFYVCIYTMWLKRSTPQNIVIGGAAGAIPPLVGWVGITGQLDMTALLLFLIVFLWTPPHFWALALNRNGDYKRAGIPMLPVISGERVTMNQMWYYSLALIPTAMLLIYTNPNLGWCSFVSMVGLGVVFSWKIYVLRKNIDAVAEVKERRAWDVFGFSLIYLALFFTTLVVDSVFL